MSGLRGAALFIVMIVAAGVIGYHTLEGYTWLEAAYMTAITLSTVGFHEVRPLGPAGQIFTIVLLVGGLGVVFYTAVTVVEKVV
ncbi:MAG: two pore domain potassium channel family protein, partial [Deltaproteobacteria bacterium]|nr:two pore domain potassium channel family protein [Deltaproteobacteria bacterium]